MKTIATLIFILFIGVTAQAQNATEEVKIDVIEMTIATETATKEFVSEKNIEIARLYRRKFSTVKKALSFTTKKDAPKMA